MCDLVVVDLEIVRPLVAKAWWEGVDDLGLSPGCVVDLTGLLLCIVSVFVMLRVFDDQWLARCY